jgi:xylulokinase
MSCVLTLDCSTTAAKVVAFDADGRVLASCRNRLSRSSPEPGWGEQSAESWWQASAASFADVMRQLSEMGEDEPSGLSITHQRETFVCLDEDGVEVRPGIMWLDTRAHKQILEFGNDEIHQISGKPAGTTPSIYKLMWLRENEPEAFARTKMVLDVHGYLVFRLTGRYVTSTASADPLSMLDMKTFVWSPQLLELAGLTAEQVPELLAPGSILGAVSESSALESRLPVGMPIVSGAGDGQCAGLGAAVVEQGTAYLSLGTSITIGVNSKNYSTSRAYRTLASPQAGDYTLEALVAAGALSIAWFREHIAQLDETSNADEALSTMAETVPPGAHGLLFLPYLTSAESPYWDSQARGAFIGLGDYHGLADMMRAILEGLAMETRMLLEAIEEETQVPISRITVMGGASRSGILMQILADVFQRDFSVARETETVALGAGILAAYGVGLEGQKDLALIAERMTGLSGTYSPLVDPAVYNKLFTIYKTLYPGLRETFAALAEFR